MTEPVSVFSLLLHAVKTYKTINGIVKFLTQENQVKEILRKIGEQEFSAAMKSLHDVQFSKNPKREIESAITIFRVAIEREISYETKIFILLCLSYLYKLLEENSLLEIFLEKSKIEFEKYCTSEKESILALGVTAEGLMVLSEGLSWVFAAVGGPLGIARKLIQDSFTKKNTILFGSYEIGTIYNWSIKTGAIKIQKEIEDFSEIVILIGN